MNEKEWKHKLIDEGYNNVYIIKDGPDGIYSDHKHPRQTAHVVLEGEMTVTTDGQSKIYKVGDRFDVPELVVHSAKMGPAGCRYIVAEK